MAKNLQLTIPKACHEGWNTMTEVEKGRYCQSCQKTVIDFTNMSDREILNHISKAPGKVCGHLHSDQLNRNMVMQKERRVPWLKYFVQFTLPALFISLKTQAQELKKPNVTQSIKDPRSALAPAISHTGELTVRGKILGDDNLPLAGATVSLKGTKQATVSDDEGNFKLSVGEDIVILVVTYIGYETRELRVSAKAEITAILHMKEIGMEYDGVVVITRCFSNKPPKPTALEIVRSIITPDSVRIFPNPVGVGNDIELELQVKQTGNYYVEVSDFNGRLMMKEEIKANAKKCQASVNTKQLLPGRYIVCVLNAAGKKIGVKKIILQ